MNHELHEIEGHAPSVLETPAQRKRRIGDKFAKIFWNSTETGELAEVHRQEEERNIKEGVVK